MAKKPYAHTELHPTITCSSSGCNQRIKMNIIERYKSHNKGELVPLTCYLHGELEKGHHSIRVGTMKGLFDNSSMGRYENIIELINRKKRIRSDKA